MRRNTAWLLAAAAMAACVGCGHNPRSLVARLRGTPADGPAVAQAGHASGGSSAGGPAARTRRGGLNHDPFIGASRSAPQTDGSGVVHAQHPFERLAAAEVEWSSAAEAPPSAAAARPAALSYLDGQLERIESAMRQWEHPARHSPANGFGPPPEPVAFVNVSRRRSDEFPPGAAAPSFDARRAGTDPETTFERLSRREEAARMEPFARERVTEFSAGHSRSVGSAMEELAPSPHAGQSHLSMIVDSDLLPRRLSGRSASPARHAPRPRDSEPDFLAVDTRPTGEAALPFRSAALSQPAARQATAGHGGLISRGDPPAAPEFISSGWPDRDPPEILPDFELSGETGRSAPKAPDMGSLWGPQAERGIHAGRVAGVEPPRTLKAIQFADKEAVVSRAPGLGRLRGPLVIALGLLLVGCGAAAMRRHVADRTG